jgi:lipopolysaccharide 1,2-glucosyltransferase
VEKLLKSSDIYLDLNLDQKLVYIYDLVKKYNKPMLSFESSRYQELSDSDYDGLYSNSTPVELVNAIRNYIQDK